MEISSAPYQAMVGYGLEEGAAGPKPQLQQQHSQEQRRPARPPQPEQALKCPRCASTNTKFCYYNNYSLSQPRYFCKGCRRYWTQGGSLRNVPVGGGCRKNKRPTSSSSSKKTVQDQDPTTATTATTRPLLLPSLLPPPLPFDPSDLTLAFAAQTPIKQASIEDSSNQNLLGINTNIRSSLAPAQDQNGFHDILRTGFIDISSMYYGGNGEETGLLPFEDGVGGAAASSGAEEASCKVGQGRDADRLLMGLPWQLDAGSVLDSGRDCGWINGVGSSTWQGLINSSLL